MAVDGLDEKRLKGALDRTDDEVLPTAFARDPPEQTVNNVIASVMEKIRRTERRIKGRGNRGQGK